MDDGPPAAPDGDRMPRPDARISLAPQPDNAGRNAAEETLAPPTGRTAQGLDSRL